MTQNTICSVLLGSLVALLLVACGTVSESTGGLTDEGFVKVVSDNSALAQTTVQVFVNNKSPESVTVLSKRKAASSQPHLYLKPGSYSIRIVDKKGNVLYNSKIFLSTRKTKIIELH